MRRVGMTIDEARRPEPPSVLPALPAGMVERPRLDNLLDGGQHHSVRLICAPAGSGKSVAVTSWARQRSRTAPVAWVQCTALADHPAAFWSSVINALRRSTGHDVIAATLPGPSQARPDGIVVLDEVLSWLARAPAGTTVVVDDFGEIAAADTQAEVQYVIDRLPTAVQFVIISRTYPPLAVHRARVEGRLLDIRGPDLAFTADETSSLMSTHHLQLSGEDIELLQQRTEGWAAGLRLAIMSLAGESDPSDAVSRFSGSTEAVSGYLTEQVLTHLSPDDRDFVLDTIVLDELTADAVAALTGRPSGHLDLERTADRIGFLVPNPGPGARYRFHPLFAELMRRELRASDPERARRQHRRAARWYEMTGLVVPAVWHATEARDFDDAARLLAPSALSLTLRGRLTDWHKLLDRFPQDMVAEDPRLLLARAIAAAFGFEGERIEMLSRRARAGLSPSAHGLEARRLRAISDLVETVAARLSGRPADALMTLTAEGPNIPDVDDSGFTQVDLDLRAMWWSTRALALLWDDQRESAVAEAERACRAVSAGAAGWPLLTARSIQALVEALDGHLTAATRVLDELAPHRGEAIPAVTPSLAIADVAAVWVALERAELRKAEELLDRADERWSQLASTASGAALSIMRARCTLLLHGRPFEAVDQLDGAFAGPHLRRGLLESLERFVRVEISLTRGQLPVAVDEARGGGPELLAYLRARAGEPPDPELTYGAQELGLQLRTLLALAGNLHQAGRREAADSLLDGALDLAEAEGYRLPFLQLAARVHPLLLDARVAAARHASLVAELLRITAPSGGRGVELTESLSPRELDVLRHLVAGMDTDEIAGDLFLSRHTIRTHTKSIYRKLSVQTKRAAVLRAAALGIV